MCISGNIGRVPLFYKCLVIFIIEQRGVAASVRVLAVFRRGRRVNSRITQIVKIYLLSEKTIREIHVSDILRARERNEATRFERTEVN